MALILNIETATTMCSVALSENGKLLALKEINAGYTHSENLASFIDEVFLNTKKSITAIDAVSVSKGPGSYTGLRIGVSLAKGICYAIKKPLIAQNTLQIMVEGIDKKDDHFYCPMIDARRMEVYCAMYNSLGKEIEPTEAKVIDEFSFSHLLESSKIVFFGDGATKCRSLFGNKPNAVFLDNFVPSAQFMIKGSEEKYEQKMVEDVAYFEPYYLKDFVSNHSPKS